MALASAWKGEIKKVGKTTYQCKCYSDNSCWPKAPEWAALNSTVDGMLKVAVPPGAACHQKLGELSTYNAAECANVQANWVNEQYL
jgi:hypothetical protein